MRRRPAFPKRLWLVVALSLACQLSPAVAKPGQAVLTAPTLLSPAAEAAVDVANPTFTWQAVAGASYYLIAITQDGGGSARQIVSGTSASTSYVPARALLAGSGYTWQVTAANAAGANAVSVTRHFVMTAALRPGAPVLTNLDGRALSDGQTATHDRPGLHWQPRTPLVEGELYELQFAYADGAVLVAWTLDARVVDARPFSVNLTDTAATSTGRLGVSCGDTYRWRVRVLHAVEPRATAASSLPDDAATALSYNDQAARRAGSDWSETWSLRVPPAPGAAPALLGPADGATIRGGVLSWSGPRAEAPLFYEYELTNASGVEGSQIRLSDNGEPFSRPLDLSATPEHALEGVGLATGQSYYWRVRAAYAVGLCWGPWSPRRLFIWQGPVTAGQPAELEAPPITCRVPGCPTDTPGPSPTNTPPPTRTPRPSATSAPLVASLPPPPLQTARPSATLSAPPPSVTPNPLPSATASAEPKPTDTLVPSDTPKPTDVPTPTDTPKPK